MKPEDNIGEGKITRESGESIFTMQRVLVVDTNKQSLMPTQPARARKLLSAGKAAVYRRYPFTIILKCAIDDPQLQGVELKVDPGSRATGIALVADFKRGRRAVFAANLVHRGQAIKKNLGQRRSVRRSRRNRKCRYRPPRFLNRTKPKGWLPPSLKSRVDNVQVWARRLIGHVPVTSIEVETVRFDTQKLENPEISGVEYQQGTLLGYEIREYLLEKWGRECAYCGAADLPLEIEHIIPKSRGGSNRVSNLTLSCNDCNQKKNSQTAVEFGYPGIQAQAKQPLKDAAAVNAIRYAVGNVLKVFGLPVGFWSGGRTKKNRILQDYPKDHWLDAVCVGETGENVYVSELAKLEIKATGRQSRQMCRVDRYGFPRTKPKVNRFTKGFQTGDIVRAMVPRGKNKGTHVGKVAVRATGSFRVGTTDGINAKYCSLVQRADGYEYN